MERLEPSRSWYGNQKTLLFCVGKRDETHSIVFVQPIDHVPEFRTWSAFCVINKQMIPQRCRIPNNLGFGAM